MISSCLCTSLFFFGFFMITSASVCSLQKTCGTCIQANGSCFWCMLPDFSGHSRCASERTLLREGCPQNSIYYSSNSAHLRKDKIVNKKRLLKPQRVVLHLVPNTVSVLSVKARVLPIANNSGSTGRAAISFNARNHIKIEAFSDCAHRFKLPKKITVCDGVKIGKLVTFTLNISIDQCFSKKKRIKFKVPGVKKPQMHLNVYSKCGCDCESKKSLKKMDHTYCHGVGQLVCGQCDCSMDNPERQCTMSRGQLPCSGVGKCICGYCRCPLDKLGRRRYSGKFCECDDQSCPKSGGLLCGGEHGSCQCGRCRCKAEYIGKACEVSLSTKGCVSSSIALLCSTHGICVNNSCVCEDGYGGPLCETAFGAKERKFCIAPNSSVVCSGRGLCLRGQCSCHQRQHKKTYTGVFCECDNFSCNRYRGKLCAGPEQGECQCGKCECREGVTGDACQLTTSVETCRAVNGKICNGFGSCVGGTCRCSSDSYYRGPTCEECPVCGGFCSANKECVLCRVFGTGGLSFEECLRCPPIKLVDELRDEPYMRLCQFIDDADDCIIQFGIKVGFNMKILALPRKECGFGLTGRRSP